MAKIRLPYIESDLLYRGAFKAGWDINMFNFIVDKLNIVGYFFIHKSSIRDTHNSPINMFTQNLP
jgi:hypothetical protein